MKRYNLLLLTDQSELTNKSLRVLSKVFRNNFIFEATSPKEAHKILEKLNIDLLIIDLDTAPNHFEEFNERYSGLTVFGTFSTLNSNTRVNPIHNRLIPKEDFAAELMAELKTIKKEVTEIYQKEAKEKAKTEQDAPNFTDFFKLAPSSQQESLA